MQRGPRWRTPLPILGHDPTAPLAPRLRAPVRVRRQLDAPIRSGLPWSTARSTSRPAARRSTSPIRPARSSTGRASRSARELTRFIQQSRAARAQPRGRPGSSSLLGQLLSNGRVFLINPRHRVRRGRADRHRRLRRLDARHRDADFLAGSSSSQGGVGRRADPTRQITPPAGGDVLLIAPQIENGGVLTTPKGEIILAAGQRQLADAATRPWACRRGAGGRFGERRQADRRRRPDRRLRGPDRIRAAPPRDRAGRAGRRDRPQGAAEPSTLAPSTARAPAARAGGSVPLDAGDGACDAGGSDRRAGSNAGRRRRSPPRPTRRGDRRAVDASGARPAAARSSSAATTRARTRRLTTRAPPN